MSLGIARSYGAAPTAPRGCWWSAPSTPTLAIRRAFPSRVRDAARLRGPLALPETDHTARLDLTGLPPDREVFVRVSFEDLSSARDRSEPLTARFRTPPKSRRDVTFAWSGDTAGQGRGVNRELGGGKGQ